MNSLNQCKILVFDLDDTLFPEHQFVQSGLQAVGQWLVEQYHIHYFFEAAWQRFETGERKFIFNHALNELGISDRPEFIQELLKVYRNHVPHLTLHPDAEWILKSFDLSQRFGLITNGALQTQQNKLKALKISSYFDAIVYCGAFAPEYWKPHPYPYLKLMEITGYAGSNCWYVGDHPVKDFIAAKQLGWTTVRICRLDGEFSHLTADETHDAHYRITSLYELKQLVGLGNSLNARNDHAKTDSPIYTASW
jgi:putative hydrolase of the HAD superfamily